LLDWFGDNCMRWVKGTGMKLPGYTRRQRSVRNYSSKPAAVHWEMRCSFSVAAERALQ